MIKTLALICAIPMPRPECQPGAANEMACMFQTTAYAAHLSRTIEIPDDHYIKILCRRTNIGKENVG